MTIYRNLTGRSSVAGYDIGDDYITVYFTDNTVYQYNYSSAGVLNIEQMKRLAIAGHGLNNFIMNNVKRSYSRRIR
jgi:hypothetical protein